MAARKSSRVNRKYKTRYRVRNWPDYERSLRSRGDVTIWFSDEAVAAWTPPASGLRGGQRQYSNLAILTSLTLRLVFHLPLRQTEGFVGSLLRLMGLDLKAPDHSTLSRRGEDVEVPRLCREQEGPIHLVVDLALEELVPPQYSSADWVIAGKLVIEQGSGLISSACGPTIGTRRGGNARRGGREPVRGCASEMTWAIDRALAAAATVSTHMSKVESGLRTWHALY